MSYDIYSRLFALMSQAVPDLENSSTDSLIYACSSGIQAVKEYFDEVKAEQYLDTMSVDMLDKYCTILDIYYDLPDKKKKEEIKEKLSAGYTEFECGDFVDKYKSMVTSGYVVADNFELKLYNLKMTNLVTTAEVMKMLDYYLPPFVIPKGNGSGLTFEELDGLDRNFHMLDEMEMPYSVFETIKL
ncbi:MAG: hypothetical protein PUE08_03565 [Eubacteriales bacterium]|nr:hypothetical protein [Eubacteriales bacterium]